MKTGVRAVSCVFGLCNVIKCMHEVNKVSTFGISYAIPHSMGYKVQTKNPEQRRCGVSENETSRSKEILSRLGIH